MTTTTSPLVALAAALPGWVDDDQRINTSRGLVYANAFGRVRFAPHDGSPVVDIGAWNTPVEDLVKAYQQAVTVS